MSDLTLGQKVPDFTLPANGGETVSLSDLSGGYVFLYFYPKDNTPGCTSEAIDFTHHLSEFEILGARVIGVSKDTVRKHDNFINKHDLQVQLLSDADSDMIERYGLWVEKKMYGKTYMGIERATLLIGPDGTLRHIWRKVKVKGHAEDVLNHLKQEVAKD